MAKFSGKVAFREDDHEVSPGIWEASGVVEKQVYGDIYRNTSKLIPGDKVNYDVNITNRVDFVGNAYFRDNYMKIIYCVWRGQKWNVTNIDILEYPRISFDLGGLYTEHEQ